MSSYGIDPVGFVESPLLERGQAPLQGNEGSPDAWLAFVPEFQPAFTDLRPGDEVVVLDVVTDS